MSLHPRFWHASPLATHDRPEASASLADVAAVRAVLVEAARARRALSYAECLDALGYRFSRPRMRALCRTLDAVDERARVSGEPELAVLVVRQADGLPGAGWWAGRQAAGLSFAGPSHGPDALNTVRNAQEAAFAFWCDRAGTDASRSPHA